MSAPIAILRSGGCEREYWKLSWLCPVSSVKEQERRATKLPSELPTALTAVFFGSVSHQQQWQAFVRRIAEPDLAFEFPAVVGAIASFVISPSIAAFGGQRFECSWCPPGPWASTR